ncbi:uncharacterized protein LOC142356021 [Convolutriloba macropyga]|uniref:uncharacterized protein LOC142356021 n=1 Tax=Convolutriloba macropyga TaxID=536237 RepID=UPI003F5225FA
MPFTRNVEIGRLAIVNFGPDYGKLVVITDVLDHHRALVDHPDQLRRVESFKRLSLTDFKVEIPRLAKKKVLKKALEESEILTKFAASSWGLKLKKQAEKTTMSDFERYKNMIAQKKKNAEVAKVLKKMTA